MNAKKEDDIRFLKAAIEEGKKNLTRLHGGPFGAIVVKDGRIIASSANEVIKNNDPTAHAEIMAIRKACQSLNTYQLDGCTIYSSCEPCPMCLGAIYWARPDRLVYAALKEDAAKAGFDDSYIYHEFSLPSEKRHLPNTRIPMEDAEELFEEWISINHEINY